MDPRHRYLERQLRKLGLGDAPPSPDLWRSFLASVNGTYEDFENERRVLKRSATLFSDEMLQLHRRVEQKQRRLSAMFEAAPVGMVRLGVPLRIIDANPAFLQIVGCTSDELEGLGDPLSLVHPDDRARADEQVKAMLRNARGAGQPTLHRLVHKSGRAVATRIGFSLVCDDEGRPDFLFAIVEDMTEVRRLEVELRHAQKLESVGRLASGIAHELNTPIQFIGDNAAFLRESLEGLLQLCRHYGELLAAHADQMTEAERHALQAAEAAADVGYLRSHGPTAVAAMQEGVARVSSIVRAMRLFAGPDRNVEPADLNAALRNTLVVAQNEIKYVADVQLELGALPLVPCRVSDLNQVFLNLLVNAAHAIADVVGSSGRKGRLRVRTYVEEHTAVIAIGDTGTGIPVDARPHIFDLFFTTKQVGRGTGQGLAICHAVIEKHGGSITFETEVGVGTTFFVRLPLEAAAVTAPLPDVTSDAAAAPEPSGL